MSGTLAPVARQQQIDENGDPYAGGLLYTYEAGTSTEAETYSDVDLATPNANPIVADASGRFGPIYLSAASYKFIFKDADGVTIWTQDNIPSTGTSGALIGQGPVIGGTPDSPITDTSYPVGTTFDELHAGTLILSLDSADLPGTYGLQGMLKGDGTVTVSAILVNLSDGAPETALATISSNSSTGARQISGAITFPAAGADKSYGVKVKVSVAGTGFVWGLGLARLS